MCNIATNESLIFYSIAFFFDCASRVALSELSWISGYMALPKQLGSRKPGRRGFMG